MKLTRRELQVRELQGLGKTLAETAHQLGIAVSTVKKHRGHVAIKLAMARSELIDETPHAGAAE